MDPQKFFALFDGQMVDLELQHELPEEFLANIPLHLDTLLDVPTLAIGGWTSDTDCPIAVALSNVGQISSIVAVRPDHLDSLADTLVSVDEWLSTMTLKELSELSGNNVEFYDGLLALSPESSITLSPQRRYVVVTGGEGIDTTVLSERLPNAVIDVHYIDVLRAPGGLAVIRQRAIESTPHNETPDVEVVPVAPPIPEHAQEAIEETVDAQSVDTSTIQLVDPPIVVPEFPPEPQSEAGAVVASQSLWTDVLPDGQWAEQDAAENAASLQNSEVVAAIDNQAIELTEVIDLNTADHNPAVAPPSEDDGVQRQHYPVPTFSVAPEVEPLPTIELTDPPPPRIGFDNPDLHLLQGSTYDVDVLPLLLDPTGSSVESISNEMFATSASIGIVVSLPERRRDSPFEDRRKFRWDTSLDRIQLLNEHGFTRNGTRRTVHLFVENDRQPGFAAYVGELSRVMFQTQTESDSETAWFSISPTLPNDFFKLIRKGRLPNHTAAKTKA